MENPEQDSHILPTSAIAPEVSVEVKYGLKRSPEVLYSIYFLHRLQAKIFNNHYERISGRLPFSFALKKLASAIKHLCRPFNGIILPFGM